ncbi:hypothetical protein EZV62_002374 [Acer yangbiense]|uniref:Uncharacterized protein n=1 Tax=Acer yangbiense TaxID=1000413 RepID=A0A5C7IX46_9ROSI|nr:hypothetical protein EZV62_002374 [Acer yangbiense]
MVLPPKTPPTDLPNPAYATWVTRDCTCKIWLHAALLDSVLPYTLKGQLQILKKGSNSIMQYLKQIKSIADGLTAAGAPFDDLDLIAHTLRGLPSEFDSFGTSIRVRAEPIDPDALHGLLINEEIELQQRDTIDPPDSTSSLQAFYTFDRFLPPQISAMIATQSSPSLPPPNSIWYADIGATNHITHDLNKSLQTPYQGHDQVLVGSGEDL